MIYWFTGQPGHGKTLHGIDQALDWVAEGRLVYACNIREFDYAKAGMLEMTPEQFRDWPNFLPDGACAIVDEAYEHNMLPKRPPGSKVPEYVQQLAKHRHRGIDFIFICQSPAKQCDDFTHDLIERHVHVRRRFGLPFAHLRIFDRYERNPEKAHPLILKRVKLPKRPMGLYKSTEVDTTEKKIPWYYPAAAVLAVLILIGAWLSISRISEAFTPKDAKPGVATVTDGAPARAGAGAALGNSGTRSYATATDYARAHLPRFGTMPWTAPIYDERGVTADPQLICASTGAGLDAQGQHTEASCTCFTEQGTLYELSVPECRTIARRGPMYNPYKTAQPMVSTSSSS